MNGITVASEISLDFLGCQVKLLGSNDGNTLIASLDYSVKMIDFVNELKNFSETASSILEKSIKLLGIEQVEFSVHGTLNVITGPDLIFSLFLKVEGIKLPAPLSFITLKSIAIQLDKRKDGTELITVA